MKIIEYGLVSRSTSKELMDCVNNLIANGWQPFGSVAIAAAGATHLQSINSLLVDLDTKPYCEIYSQAMVKYSHADQSYDKGDSSD